MEREVAMKRLITSDVVAAEFAAGKTTLLAPRGQTIVTPGAWSRAHELGVTIVQSETPAATAAPAPKRTERVVGPNGLTLVRGESVTLSPFPGAGPDRDVRVADLITARDGSPMTAGIMSWAREDSFPWSLDYDEVDLVLEGVLQITIDGHTLEGRAGDVFFIPRGSTVLFGTPWRTKVFYVTYPADWAAAGAAPARPQK
ncbi:MAG: cupin domain-containing protein [Myxococcales bacterium]|nr:cupin domain-containing protein [Myxococcales bacterium]